MLTRRSNVFSAIVVVVNKGYLVRINYVYIELWYNFKRYVSHIIISYVKTIRYEAKLWF